MSVLIDTDYRKQPRGYKLSVHFLLVVYSGKDKPTSPESSFVFPSNVAGKLRESQTSLWLEGSP